jgi:hypothetical protein
MLTGDLGVFFDAYEAPVHAGPSVIYCSPAHNLHIEAALLWGLG